MADAGPHNCTHIPMLPSLRFRTRLILACSALVALTTILMLVPLLVSSNDQSESIYRERLTAVAHGASASLPADTVELLAATSAPTSIPYIVVRNVLREFSWRTTDTLHVDPGLGLLLVTRRDSGYRVLAHSDWPVVRPADTLSWAAPPGLADRLANLRAGTASLWWFSDDARLMAVSPVFAGTVPVGLVVASAPRAVATAETRRVLARLIWYPVFALVLAVGLAILLARQLTHRIERLARQANVLASGDLRAQVTDAGDDEFGRLASSLRDLADHLRDTLSGMSASASSVAAAVEDLAVGAHEMNVSTTQLAAAAAAITDSATRQTDGIRSIASLASASALQANAVSEFAGVANDTAMQIAAITQRISADSTATLARMTDISRVSAEATPAVAALADKSRRITVVAQAIAQLADQAQLLSLNASIEAARAGVHGRGFGVVAREVRVLADGTSEALDDIRSLAAEIEELSRHTGKRMDEMQSSVAQGEAVIHASNRSLGEIIAAVEAGRSANREISEHAVLQETRAADVSAHVAVIGDVAIENAGMARQVIAAVEAQSAVATSVAQSTTRLGDVVTQLRDALVGFDL